LKTLPTRPMRLLHVIPTYKPAFGYGGPIISIGLLCENLVAKGGCEVVVAATNANIGEDLPVHDREPVLIEGVKVFYFRRITPDHSQLSPALLRYLWHNARQFDVVHIHSWWNLSVMLGTLVCLLRGVRPVLSPRGMLSPFSLKGFGKSLYQWLLGNRLLTKTHLHATADAERAECLTLVPNWQHTVLPNFLDIAFENTQNSAKADNNTFNLLFLSRIHEKKGLDILLNALAQLPFAWTFQIAGDGDATYIAQLKQQATDLGIADRITWLGFVATADRFDVLAQADMLVLPSHNENFANVVIESLSVGTPVLVSRHVGLASYVVEKKLGWVCDTTVESVRSSLATAYFQLEERQRIRAAAPRQIHADFDPSLLVQRYMEMYEKVVGKAATQQQVFDEAYTTSKV
jgi:glycosyltransferase involved in cell wall biosynthesis